MKKALPLLALIVVLSSHLKLDRFFYRHLGICRGDIIKARTSRHLKIIPVATDLRPILIMMLLLLKMGKSRSRMKPAIYV
jgi:hypothetical protein